MKKILLAVMISIMTLVMGCGNSNIAEAGNNDITEGTISTNGIKSGVQKITAEEAKAFISEEDYDVILDVRSQEEYEAGHIKNAILLPDYEVGDRAEEVLQNKNAKILVYCRSGRRSQSASKLLNKLGYENVYDFGGIIDWPYEIVTE